MTKHFAVFGNPIAQSKSPQIHHLFAQQFDLKINYERLLSSTNSFSKDLNNFFSHSGIGCNVTAPFKEQAYCACASATTAAKRARAANTIYLNDDNQLFAHNSDGAGLVNDLLKNQLVDIADSHIIVLGAGGATRGILEPIIAEKPASIVLANRTITKAEQLAEEFADLYDIQTTSTDNPQFSDTPDLLINATSASLTSSLPVSDSSLIGQSTVCYDLSYKKEPTAFLAWATQAGAVKTLDGKGMLAEQAAISFQLWTGHTPDTENVIAWLADN